MDRIFKVAAVDASHGHIFGLLREAINCPLAQVVGFADGEASNRDRVVRDYGLSHDQVFSDYRMLADRVKPDVVICCSPNAKHVEYVEDLAPRGVHVLIEKPFAARLGEVDRMIAAAARHGTYLMCNYPVAWQPSMRRAYDLVQAGTIGRVFQIALRGGHAGPTGKLPAEEMRKFWWYRPELGGGVLLDYCCYGAFIASWFLGKLPRKVMGMAMTIDRPVEADDNAALLVQYDDALCMFGATWTRPAEYGNPFGPVINGLNGSLSFLSGDDLRLALPGKEVEKIDVSQPMPEGERNGVEYFLNCIANGRPVGEPVSLKTTRMAQEILEAGLRSVETGRTVELPVKV
ncbi:MAG: Gfo/Idh/MocA family oxidoreductase [Candidatus Latescibacteria bacterium]|nr:Gfo/Idh/MocA family oxidoreductase [Candidatus Latescibacterota bacterium]